METQELLSVAEELAAISRLVADDDIDSVLMRYTRRLVSLVPDCAAAFVAAADPDDGITVTGTWTPAGSSAMALGPVAEALTYREPRHLPDVDTDGRWPDFCAELRRAGFRSALVLSLSRSADTPAVLVLLAAEPAAFGDTSYDLVQLFVAHAGAVLDNAAVYADCAGLVEQLRTSLRTRSTIGQAQGLLMREGGTDSAAAFAALKQASQHHNVKLRDLAEDLVRAHENSRFSAALRRYSLA